MSAVLQKVVERVEELLLQAVLALHELDVVDQQHIVAPVEELELRLGAVPYRLHELIQEGLAGDVAHLVRGVMVVHVVSDRPQKVGLS